MAKYSNSSCEKLYTCDERLVRVFERVVQTFDNTILVGHRDEATQQEMYEQGKSQLQYPNSKHNSFPSKAVDAAPYPIDWDDRERFTLFAGFVLGIAEEMGIYLRWGGDWDRDWQTSDNSFDDLVHFEIIDD